METAAAIDWVGSDTAPGPDGHVPGVYKLAKPGMTRILTAFFNLCWSTGRTPSQWKGCHVRMLRLWPAPALAHQIVACRSFSPPIVTT